MEMDLCRHVCTSAYVCICDVTRLGVYRSPTPLTPSGLILASSRINSSRKYIEPHKVSYNIRTQITHAYNSRIARIH